MATIASVQREIVRWLSCTSASALVNARYIAAGPRAGARGSDLDRLDRTWLSGGSPPVPTAPPGASFNGHMWASLAPTASPPWSGRRESRDRRADRARPGEAHAPPIPRAEPALPRPHGRYTRLSSPGSPTDGIYREPNGRKLTPGGEARRPRRPAANGAPVRRR